MPRKSQNRKTAAGYIAYYRVSTARQGASGLGLDAQREAVTRLAKDSPILAEFTEVESGNRHENRPQLLAASPVQRSRESHPAARLGEAKEATTSGATAS